MKLPFLNHTGKKEEQVVVFGGLNLTETTRDGEFLFCEGVTTQQYPVLRTRCANVTEFNGTDVPVGTWRSATTSYGISYQPQTGFVSMDVWDSVLGFTQYYGFENKTAKDVSAIRGVAMTNFMLFPSLGILFEGLTGTFLSDESLASLPDLTCAVAWNNRLWTVDGHTVYGSALGKPLVFEEFNGLSTDSYSVAVDSPEPLTAVMGYGSHLLIFSESRMWRLYGDLPSNFTLQEVRFVGTRFPYSFATDNAVLYWVGSDGDIYAYTGNLPQNISRDIGLTVFGDVDCFGAVKDGNYRLLAGGLSYEYDPVHHLWVTLTEQPLLRIDPLVLDTSYRLLDFDLNYEGRWSVTFAPFREDTAARKGYHSLVLDLDFSGYLTVAVSEGDGLLREVFSATEATMRTLQIPLPLNRCDKYNVRIVGEGTAVIRRMTKKYCIYSDK